MTDIPTTIARPKQLRSQRTLERLLETAERLISERGFDKVSIAALVREAGSSVGGFYGRFQDKDELLFALHERLVKEIDRRVAAFESPGRFDDATLGEIVRPCVRELVSVYRERRQLFAAIAARSVQNEQLWELGKRLRASVIDRFAALVLRRRDQITHPDPELAVELGAQMVFALMDQAVIFGELRVRGEPVSDEQVADELERSFIAYLGVRGEDP